MSNEKTSKDWKIVNVKELDINATEMYKVWLKDELLT